MYIYEGTDHQSDRIAKNRDHCGLRVRHGPTYELRSLMVGPLIHDPSGTAPLTTSPISYDTNVATVPVVGLDVYIFAIDDKFSFRVAPDGQRGCPGAVKHESLFDNANVLAAGEIWFDKGLVNGINDHSGTYVCRGDLASRPDFAAAILEATAKGGLPASPALARQLKTLAKKERGSVWI